MTLTSLITQALTILSVTNPTGDAAARAFALMAINAAKKQAELNYDWRFSWGEGQFVLDGSERVDLGTEFPLLKSIEFAEAYTTSSGWVLSSVGGGKYQKVVLQRLKTQHGRIRKAEKENSYVYSGAENVLLLQGNSIYCSDVEQVPFTCQVSGYFFTSDYADEEADEDFFLTHGWEYLLWYAVVFMNKQYGVFLPRQEGVQPEPKSMWESALMALQNFDTFQHESSLDNEMNW